MAILQFFKMAANTFLYFQVFKILTIVRVKVKLRHCTKFRVGLDRSNGC